MKNSPKLSFYHHSNAKKFIEMIYFTHANGNSSGLMIANVDIEGFFVECDQRADSGH